MGRSNSMTLKEFLEARKKSGSTPGDRLQAYADAVGRLMTRIKGVVTPFPQLTIEEWLPLLKERGVTYNAPALTVVLEDDQITIEPVGTEVVGSKGRVRMACGVREVHLDWAGTGDDWTFRWVNPRTTEAAPLTDGAIEEIVQGLLA